MESKCWTDCSFYPQVAHLQPGHLSKVSPIHSGKVHGMRNSRGQALSDDSSRPGGFLGQNHLAKRSTNSGPPSPTVSEDSEGSGATFRSAESLHRPTPIPQEAASSYSL